MTMRVIIRYINGTEYHGPVDENGVPIDHGEWTSGYLRRCINGISDNGINLNSLTRMNGYATCTSIPCPEKEISEYSPHYHLIGYYVNGLLEGYGAWYRELQRGVRKLHYSGFYRHGQRHGRFCTYEDHIETQYYVNDELETTIWANYLSFAHKYKKFQCDKYTESIRYYDKIKLISESNIDKTCTIGKYMDGDAIGIWRRIYPDGRVELGKKKGNWKHYEINGTIIFNKYFGY